MIFEVQAAQRKLLFADTAKQFGAGDGNGCIVIVLEPEYGSGARLDATMVLLNQVV